MRALALLAAITFMHTVHAIPHPDLAVREVVDDLSNERHVFHHLDRNQRTAARDRERLLAEHGEGTGLSVVKRLVEELQRAGRRTTEKERESVVERRFMPTPDYSQGGSEGGSKADHGSATMPKAKGEISNSHGRY